MTTYRSVAVRWWDEEWFRCRSTSAKVLFLNMVTGRQTSAIPGLARFSLAVAAEEIGLSANTVKKAFAEILGAGPDVAVYDEKVRVLYVPVALDASNPVNPNAILSWRRSWSDIPDCEVKRRALSDFERHCEARGLEFLAKLREISRNVRSNVAAKVPANDSGTIPPSGTGTGTSTGAGEARARVRDAPAVLSDDGRRVRSLLDEARDLWPQTHVDDDELDAVAERIAKKVLAEPTAKRDGVTPTIATEEAIAGTREWAARYTTSTPEQRLAHVETHVTKYILGDCRAGKRRKAPSESENRIDLEHEDEMRRRLAEEIAERERRERQARRLRRGEGGSASFGELRKNFQANAENRSSPSSPETRLRGVACCGVGEVHGIPAVADHAVGGTSSAFDCVGLTDGIHNRALP